MSGAGGATSSTRATATNGLIEELQQMALDPTLEDCCRRDLQEQIQAERIKQALQRDDRVEARQRMAAGTLVSDPSLLASATHSARPTDSRAPLQQQPGHQHQQQQEQGEPLQQQQQQPGDAGDDWELEQLRQQRMQQLRVESARKQEQQREGLGVLNTVPESSVLRLCQEPPGRGLVVLHLAVQGHEPCNTLDECLEEAAAQHRGTYFARCVVSRNSPLVATLQLPHGVPALLVAKHGAVLGKAHIHQFGGGADIRDEEVLAYLRRFKVLSTGDTSSSAGLGETAARSAAADSDDDDDADSADGEGASDWQTPCEVCGRTYPHKHIRAIYSSRQEDSSDDSED